MPKYFLGAVTKIPLFTMNINIFCKVISESFANKPQAVLINSTLFNHLPQVLKGASFASKSNFLWETPSFDYIPEDQD